MGEKGKGGRKGDNQGVGERGERCNGWFFVAGAFATVQVHFGVQDSKSYPSRCIMCIHGCGCIVIYLVSVVINHYLTNWTHKFTVKLEMAL